jgi:hypothetical protein
MEIRLSALPDPAERKPFFFEKKNQKTFVYFEYAPSCPGRTAGRSAGIKVFCFFFSKKKGLLA